MPSSPWLGTPAFSCMVFDCIGVVRVPVKLLTECNVGKSTGGLLSGSGTRIGGRNGHETPLQHGFAWIIGWMRTQQPEEAALKPRTSRKD
eukprot:6035853-Amphidinium_carterae.1